jgi:hypothetical protein
MSLTILNRLDIDINWYFTAISVGFTIHKRGFQLSLIFFDINVYYMSPARRAEAKQSFHERFADMIKDKE